jgi:hypothetical protein
MSKDKKTVPPPKEIKRTQKPRKKDMAVDFTRIIDALLTVPPPPKKAKK